MIFKSFCFDCAKKRADVVVFFCHIHSSSSSFEDVWFSFLLPPPPPLLFSSHQYNIKTSSDLNRGGSFSKKCHLPL